MMTIRLSAAIMLLVFSLPVVSFGTEPTSSLFLDDTDLEEILSDIPSHLTLETATYKELLSIPYINPLQASAFVPLRDSLKTTALISEALTQDKRFSPLQASILSQLPSNHALFGDTHIRTRTGTIFSPGEPTGNSLHYYAKTSLELNRCLRVNALIDRDPTEPEALDFYSGNFIYHTPDGTFRILVGDYRPGFSQGLVFSRYTRYFLSGTDVYRRDTNVIANTSYEETRYLRGVYFQHQGKFASLSTWGSYRKLDAALDDDDQVVSIRTTGIHTSNDSRNNLSETLYGIRSAVHLLKHSQLAFTVSSTHYSQSYSDEPDERRMTSPSGQDFLHLSLDGHFKTDESEVFFEHARLFEKGTATIGGISLHTKRLTTSLTVRHYDSDFYSRHAAPFSTFGTSSNEEGVLWASAFSVSPSTDIETSYDLGKTLTRRYYSDMPEKRGRLTGILRHDISSSLSTRMVIRNTHDLPTNSCRRSFLVFMEHKRLSSSPDRFRTALAWSESRQSGGPYAEISARFHSGELTADALISLYDIVSYDSRFYRYAPDVSGRGGTIAYWGRGHGVTLVLQWKYVSLRYISIQSDERTKYERFTLQLDAEC